MPLEIERKFLVTADAWRAAAHKRVAMRHGYLTQLGAPASVRVRVEGDVGKLNVKQAVVGTTRAEYEYTIPADEADEMIRTLCRGLILKTRHYVNHAGHLWEVDEFEGDNSGLVVAEIELSSADEAFARPDWLGAEITSEQRYYNNALASHPFNRWSAVEANDHLP
jgi:adenylate cyclase